MTLREWLNHNETTQADFGQRIGVTQGRVSQIAENGTHDLGIALRIQRQTGGAVTVSELLSAKEKGAGKENAA